MLKFLSLITCTLILTFTSQGSVPGKKKYDKWVSIDATITNVFSKELSKSRLQVIRLYDNNEYELLHYSIDRKMRNTIDYARGTFQLKNNILRLKKTKTYGSKTKTFHEKFYLYRKNVGLTKNLFHAVFFKNKIELKETSENEFKLPFYICPWTGNIASNKGSDKMLDLADLAQGLVKYHTSEREKVTSVEQFVIRTLDYKQMNRVDPIEKLLAGRARKGVCHDFTRITDTLLSLAGFESHYVLGAARNSFKDVLMSEGWNHAWNVVTIDGKQEIHDVTWWEGAGMQWINVDPEIMIYSHFPKEERFQLLKNPITKNEFDHLPVIDPYRPGAKLDLGLNIPSGILFADSILDLEITTENELFTFNESDANSQVIYNKRFTYSSEGLDHELITSADGTQFCRIPLSRTVNFISVTSSDVNCEFTVVNGAFDDLMKHYIDKYSSAYEDPYVRGVVAAIRLNDMDKLKSMVGDTNKIFFDKKGNLAIDQLLLDEINNWDGLLGVLQISTLAEYTSTKGESPKITVEKYIQLGEFKFLLGSSGGRVIILEIKGPDAIAQL